MTTPRGTVAQRTPRAAIYVRVSTARQGEEGQSLDVQEARCRASAAAKGAQHVAIYRDEYSGRSAHRPGLRRLIADIEAGVVNRVIVYKLDRAFRSIRDFFTFEAICEKHNVAFVSSTEDIDTSTAAGKLQRTMLAALAQFYSDLLSERMKDSMDARASAGQYCGGTPPWGYRAIGGGKGIEPDPAKAPLVAEIFRLYVLAGHSSTSIARELRARGHSHISKRLVLLTLRNPTYIGKQVWGGKTWPARHQPIVSEEVFKRAQDKLSRAGEYLSTPRRTAKAAHAYLLDGLACCGTCGGHLTTSTGTGKGGVTYAYYRCVKAANVGGCNMRIVNAGELERVTIDRLIKLSLNPEALRQATAKRSRQDGAAIRRLKAQLALHASELETARKRVTALMNLAGTGGVTDANKGEWNAELTRWTAARDACQLRHSAVADELAAAETRTTSDLAIPVLIRAVADKLCSPDSGVRRAAVRSLLYKVIVCPDRLRLQLRGEEHETPSDTVFVGRGSMAPPTARSTNTVHVEWPMRWKRGLRVELVVGPDDADAVMSEISLSASGAALCAP